MAFLRKERHWESGFAPMWDLKKKKKKKLLRNYTNISVNSMPHAIMQPCWFYFCTVIVCLEMVNNGIDLAWDRHTHTPTPRPWILIHTNTTEGAAAFWVRGHSGENAVCGTCQETKAKRRDTFRYKALADWLTNYIQAWINCLYMWKWKIITVSFIFPAHFYDKFDAGFILGIITSNTSS